MPEALLNGLELLARALEIVGASALVIGFIVATAHCVRRGVREGLVHALDAYRKSLGRVVLIGLEILVAATIIRTITLDPTMEGMGMLAGMVVIRTMLGWAMVLELNGRWPWQKLRAP